MASTGHYRSIYYCCIFVRCLSGSSLQQVLEKFLQLIDPTTYVFSPVVLKVVSYLYAVSVDVIQSALYSFIS